MKMIQHSIKTLDFLGPKINFTIKGEQNFKTVLSGFLSLIVYCQYVFFFIYFGRDMIFKLNPTVTMESLIPDNLEKYLLTNKTIIAYNLGDLQGKIYEGSEYFKADVNYEIIDNREKRYDKIPLSIGKCSEDRFLPFFNESIFNASEWFCLDFSKIYDRPIYRDTKNYQVISFISFGLDICKHDYNKSIKYDCSDHLKIQEHLKTNNLLINILFNEVVFSPNNYTDPLERRIAATSNILNFNIKRYDVMNFQKTIVEQDDGFLFSGGNVLVTEVGISKLDKYFIFRSQEEVDNYYSKSNEKYNNMDNMYNLLIGYQQEYRKYTRKYMKMQDVFGNVKGFMEFLIFVFSVFNFYTDYRFDFYLFNEIVNVRVNEKENGNCASFSNRKFLKVDKRNDIELREFNQQNKSEFKRDIENINGEIKVDKSIPNDLNEGLSNRSIALLNKKIKDNCNDEKDKKLNCVKNPEKEIQKINQEFHSIVDKNKNYTIDNIISIPPNSIKKISKNVSRNLNNLNDRESQADLKSLLSKLYRKKNLKNYFNNNKRNKSLCHNGDNDIDLKNLEEILLARKTDRFLIPNCIDYYVGKIKSIFNCCKNHNGKKSNFNLRLLNLYLEKINNKFDIFYYLKWLRDFKNLKEFVLNNRDEKNIFKILSESPYEFKLNKINNESIFEKKKINRNEIIQSWIKKLEGGIDNNSFTNYVVSKTSNLGHKDQI